MCYYTKLTASIKKIENEFRASFYQPELYHPQEDINGFAFGLNPIIVDEDADHIVMGQWGLIPFWAKDASIQKMTLNARIETAATKPAFRQVVGQRCLVLAEGFYEWQWLDSKGKKKQKFYITPQAQELFGFAGFYSEWRNPVSGKHVLSYSIVTTEANALMETIHNIKKRMPVIIKKEDRQRWLAGEALETFAFPYEVDLLSIVY
jgi:putative SOS response-associated peptidase YedK